MPTVQELYLKKLMTASEAVKKIKDKSNLMISMGVSMPPALMRSVADRAVSGDLSSLNAYYMHASSHASQTILSPEVMSVIKPHSLFMSSHDRQIEKLGLEKGETLARIYPEYLSSGWPPHE